MKNFRMILTGISVLCLSAASAWSAELRLYGTFPAEWLQSVDDVYPITSAPDGIQWEAWLAVRSMSSAPANEKIVIDAYGSGRAQAQKLVDYFVEHHNFPAGRFKIELVNRPEWNGWVVVHPAMVEVPDGSPTLDRAPSLATLPPVAIPRDPAMVSTQAAPLPRQAMRAVGLASTVQGGFLAGARGPELRPFVGIEWFALEGSPSLPHFTRATWLGSRAGAELALVRWPISEIGISGHYYHSFDGVTTDAQASSVNEIATQAYWLMRANSTLMGVPMIRVFGGLYSNRRDGDPSLGFLPAILGPRFGTELSTRVDGIFTLGVSGAYTAALDGVYEAGGFLSHRFFSVDTSNWEARLAITADSARVRNSAGLQKESWLTMEIGLTGNL
jgi:hypothetical protein